MRQILIVEDEIIIAEDLRAFFIENTYAVSGIAHDYHEAMNLYLSMKPDIVVCDIHLKGQLTGIDFVQDIQAIEIKPVIFLTAFSGDELLDSVANLKCTFFLSKPVTRIQLLCTLSLACKKFDSGESEGLTVRERLITKMLTQGKNSGEIADVLKISVETVRTHRKHIFAKLEVHSIAELVSKMS